MGDGDGRLFLSSGAVGCQTFERNQGVCEGEVPSPAVGVPRGGPTLNAWRGLMATCAP